MVETTSAPGTAKDSGGIPAWRTVLRRHWFLGLLLLVAWMVRWPDLLLKSLDWDESNVLSVSMLPVKDMVWFTFTHDFHPPGVHLTLAAWTHLFGFSELALRCFGLLWGVVAVAGGYLLAWELSKSRFTSGLTGLFLALMPMAVRYSHFFTPPTFFYALVLFSWYFLLKIIRLPDEQSLGRSFSFWAYVLITFWACMQYASGPFFMLFQGVYFGWCYRQLAPRHRTLMLWTGLALVAVHLPHVWVLSQPWHVAHSDPIKRLHPMPGPLFFLLSPLILLFYNFDLRLDGNDLQLAPPVPALIPALLVVYVLLVWGFRKISQEKSTVLPPLLLIGPLPLLVAYLLGYAGFSFFNFRSLLFASFPFYYAFAYLIRGLYGQGLRSQAAMLTAVLLIAQCLCPIPLTAFNGGGWDGLGRNLRAAARPGDGIVVYPGLMALPLLYYYRFPDFGISPQQLAMDPRSGDNFFNEVDRIDDRYFLVTGNEVMRRPAVRHAFVEFQKQHRRILWALFQSPDELLPLVDCSKEMWLVDNKGRRPLDCSHPQLH